MNQIKNIFYSLALSSAFLTNSVFANEEVVQNALFTSQINTGQVVYSYPGERIRGKADVTNPGKPQIVVGLGGIGVQSGISGAPFILKAPEKPGIYEIQFKLANQGKNAELRNWANPTHSPSKQNTLGLLIVVLSPEEITQEINDSNWREWLFTKNSSKNN